MVAHIITHLTIESLRPRSHFRAVGCAWRFGCRRPAGVRSAWLRRWWTAVASLATLASSARSPPRFSPCSMRARKTICRLTGSLSAIIALPAKHPRKIYDLLGHVEEDSVLAFHI